jgi:Na+:H+ antiporter, NhaA family
MAYLPAAMASERSPSLFGAVVRPIQAFARTEAASGVLLLATAAVALLWANLHPASYGAAFDYPLALGFGGKVSTFTVGTLINDGLMSIFFFVVGMEIKRELVVGELNSVGKASLPLIAAIGGMALPAGIYIAFNAGGPGQVGWGIPMATDIAFCIGIVTLLKDRVSHGLVVFLTALAIFDDIGGILVIALFYGHGLSAGWLLVAAGLLLVLLVMNRAYVISGLAYALVGLGLWYAVHHGGVHATIAGVLLGLMIPARPPRAPREVLRQLADHVAELQRRPADAHLEAAEILAIEEKLEEAEAPVQRFVHLLHPYVAFAIMPVFALANSGIAIGGEGGVSMSDALGPIAAGTALGLVVGKMAGVFGLTLLAVKLGVAPMPGGSTPMKVFGVSVLAGIGFTVALFIATLAFDGAPELLSQAKVGTLLGSFVAGVAGYTILRLTPRI